MFRDDGAGINTDAVRHQAIARGLIDPARATSLSENEILDLIFEPGFSTAQTVSDISGRGIGMSAVKSEAEKLGGKVTVLSEANVGTTIVIRIPVAVNSLKIAA